MPNFEDLKTLRVPIRYLDGYLAEDLIFSLDREGRVRVSMRRFGYEREIGFVEVAPEWLMSAFELWIPKRKKAKGPRVPDALETTWRWSDDRTLLDLEILVEGMPAAVGKEANDLAMKFTDALRGMMAKG